MLADPILPADAEAERALLGAVLVSPEAITLAGGLDPEDLASLRHRQIWRAMLELDRTGQPIDPVQLVSVIATTGDPYERSNAVAWMAGLITGIPKPANVGAYAATVRERATARRLATAAHAALEAAEAGLGSDEIRRRLSVALEGAEARLARSFVPTADSITATLDAIEDRARRGESTTGIPTGFPRLDRMLSGMQRGDMLVLAARPSMGKTAFALNVMSHVATTRPGVTGFFSLEMAQDSLNQRLLSTWSGVEFAKIRSGQLDPDEWCRLAEGHARLSTSRLEVDDTGALSTIDIRARARGLAAKHRGDVDLLVVDYLQIARGPRHRENRTVEVTEISQALKALAKELSCPVLVLSQLNRVCEARQDKRPMLSDLRDSGAIEQDADVVMFLFRPEVYIRDGDPRKLVQHRAAELIIAKQRNGPLGTVSLDWDRDFQRFEEV